MNCVLGDHMLRRLLQNSFAIVIAFSVFLGYASAWPHKLGKKARVTFAAEGTMIRGTWGLNEDNYLVSLSFTDVEQSTIARLIDTYPNEWAAISLDALTAQNGTVLRVIRDSHCDVEFRNMPLRAAPGDLMAILPLKLKFRPQLRNELAPETKLPCYRYVRR